MRMLGIALLVNASSISAILAASYLALLGITGWGWFLLVAVLLHTTYSAWLFRK